MPSVATEPQSGVRLRAACALLPEPEAAGIGSVVMKMNQVTELRWYVIRMPGGVEGGGP